jgi:hypothetical protein
VLVRHAICPCATRVLPCATRCSKACAWNHEAALPFITPTSVSRW